MGQYTYILKRGEAESTQDTYRQKDLEKMTLFHLKEICRKERLVIPSFQDLDREGLIRLIMKFRGQREYRHIQIPEDRGLERIQEAVEVISVQLCDEQRIHVPGTIILYKGLGLDKSDSYKIQSSEKIYEGNMLLADEEFQIYTCFYIHQEGGEYYLYKGKEIPVRPLGKHQYYMIYFPNERDSEFLYDCYYGNHVAVPGYIKGVKIPLLDIQERETKESDFPLVIDFGSSNTTMGIGMPDGKIQIAADQESFIIPSIIGIRSVVEDKAEFVFGYGAKNLYEENYQDEDVTIFYDIKRWVSNPDQKESVILKNGYRHQVSRREMLKAYLEYLLNLACQQFKCIFREIQLLAPIRQKEKFRQLFTELLPEYKVDCDLDEGMAVLFYDISQMMERKSYEPDQWYHTLSIDCGGGTTDLTSGRFRISNNRVSYAIDLETRYENGDTNFGGNNLTYRILQMLKIRIAEGIGHGERKQIVIDGTGDAYGGLEELYRYAEEIIPTKFQEYEERGRDQYFRVKNNYYYLFETAETIKKRFFQPRFFYELLISTKEKKDAIFLDRWKLSIWDGVKFGPISQSIEVAMYLDEIEDLLRPEVYRMMERFLERKFIQGELMNYQMIKLTGQSCKSRLFAEALKQYIPGKLIQDIKKDKDGAELKLCCLKGALAYLLNSRLGYMKVNQDYQVVTLPYEIMAYTHENKEKILIRSLDREDHIGCISRFRIGNQLDLYLYDDQGRKLKTYYFVYNASTFDRTTQEEIDKIYSGTVIQEETDTILEGEMKFFVWISKKRWGFVVLPILRDEEILYKGNETFFDFEDNTWEMNFFNGKK